MNSNDFTTGFLYFDGSTLTFSLRLRTAETLQRFCGPKGRAEKHGCTVMSVGEPRVKGGQFPLDIFKLMGDSFPWIGSELHFFSSWNNPQHPFCLVGMGGVFIAGVVAAGWYLELAQAFFPPISIMSRLTTISQADLVGI